MGQRTVDHRRLVKWLVHQKNFSSLQHTSTYNAPSTNKFNPVERFRGVQHQLNYVNGTHRFSKYPLLRAVIEGGKENKNCIYCVVSVHLYSASNRTHSAEALPVRETQREGSNLLEQIDQAIGSPVKKRDAGCKLKERPNSESALRSVGI